MPGIYGYIKQSIDDKQIENMSKELFYQNNFIQDDTFSNDYLECSHIHIGNIKKSNNYFLKDGIYVFIEGEQYDFKNISFEEFEKQSISSLTSIIFFQDFLQLFIFVSFSNILNSFLLLLLFKQFIQIL